MYAYPAMCIAFQRAEAPSVTDPLRRDKPLDAR